MQKLVNALVKNPTYKAQYNEKVMDKLEFVVIALKNLHTKG